MGQKKQGGSRVPAAVGALPVVGGIVKTADQQAQWLQEVVEQQARLVGQLPATLKSLNDSIERFNQTVNRLDRTAARIEAAVGVLPDALDSLRKEAVPALRAATDTQRQVALLQATLERAIAVIGELPGAGFVKRMAAGASRAEDPSADAT